MKENMNKDINQKNVEWEYNECRIAENLVIKCPCKHNSDFIEMTINIEILIAHEQFNQMVKFLYKDYPEVCWEYIEEMRRIFTTDIFFDETFVKFLIEIIPDFFPDWHFSIDLTKMLEIHEEDIESNISKAIEIDVEVDTIESIAEVADIKQIISWLEEKTGFDVILTKCFIQSNFKVKGII